MPGTVCAYKKCNKPNIQIAPFDPERVQVDLEIFHQSCLRKKRLEEQEERSHCFVRSSERLVPRVVH